MQCWPSPIACISSNLQQLRFSSVFLTFFSCNIWLCFCCRWLCPLPCEFSWSLSKWAQYWRVWPSSIILCLAPIPHSFSPCGGLAQTTRSRRPKPVSALWQRPGWPPLGWDRAGGWDCDCCPHLSWHAGVRCHMGSVWSSLKFICFHSLVSEGQEQMWHIKPVFAWLQKRQGWVFRQWHISSGLHKTHQQTLSFARFLSAEQINGYSG